ncbi:hypothetical protein NKY66_30210, partial [Sinorhizobium meliloti]|uniref:hypothetical protein n=1 Tax=Rhizobium meliloti TaxID=382 RepID=UPI003D64785C
SDQRPHTRHRLKPASDIALPGQCRKLLGPFVDPGRLLADLSKKVAALFPLGQSISASSTIASIRLT